MRIERLAKDPDSITRNCPSVYLAESGDLVVQGDLLDEDTTDRLEDVLAHEGAVTIKRAIVEEALRRLADR